MLKFAKELPTHQSKKEVFKNKLTNDHPHPIPPLNASTVVF